MKIFKVLLVVAIAFGMMACNNEQGVPEISGEKDASISIKVFPSSDSPSFRATGDLSGDGITEDGLDAESAIKKLEVWVFRTSDGVLTGFGAATTNEVNEIAAIAGSSTIVVVANASIGIKATLADLLDEVKALPARDISTDGLVMTSEPFEVTLMAGKNQYGYPVATGINNLSTVERPITRVNARVAIVAATLNYGVVPATQKALFDELKDVEVAMFNVPNETKLFGDPLATNTAFQYGDQWPSPALSYVGSDDATPTPNTLLLEGPLTAPTVPPSTVHNLIINTDAPFFYVNENTSTTAGEKMIIVLRAKPYKGGVAVTSLEGLYTDEDGYTYYPVWVNKDGLTENGNVGNSNVYRNTQYNISLTINGLGNPTIDPVDKAWLDVKVSVSPWTVVDQNVTW